MKRHLNLISGTNSLGINSLGINREPAALDRQEVQFFERCRRGTTNVPYPRHISVPTPVPTVQRRGLTYPSAAGHRSCMPLPVIGPVPLEIGSPCATNRPNLACDGAAC
ncbi:MAG: hypothetical protein AB4042_11665 [Leptolyngbyaceae cyanobacterium]